MLRSIGKQSVYFEVMNVVRKINLYRQAESEKVSCPVCVVSASAV